MTIEATHQARPADTAQPLPERPHEPAGLDGLMTHVIKLSSDATQQLKGAGELAFLEFELAVEALQWSVCLLLVLVCASIMTFTLLVVAVLLLLIPESSGVTAVLLCALVSALTAICLFLALRSVARKMYFPNLRQQLLGAPRDSAQ